MSTIFLTVYDGDTEKVILQTGVLTRLIDAGHRIVLLVRGTDRLEYYRKTYDSELVSVEELPIAMTRTERLWYHLGWNTLPTRSAYIRRRERFENHQNYPRFTLESLLGFLGRFRLWREVLRLCYRLVPDAYCAEYFERYKPNLVFAPNMFSAEDMRMLRAAKRRGIKTVATAKSWDVLTTKAFTRVRADRLLVFNEVNREEAIHLGDYSPERVIVTGFPQFDLYTHNEWKDSRTEFCARLGLDASKKILLFAIPGNWKTPNTKDILAFLDEAIEKGRFKEPLQILARLHPKYPDSSEQEEYRHIILDRPGTHFSDSREVSIDMNVAESFQWTFTRGDVEHLANSLYWSELIINTESTLTLDAAMLGKPTLLIGYDGNQKLPYWKSVKRVYEREHYRNVLATGATPLVENNEQLFTTIEEFLAQPDRLASERNVLVMKLLYSRDGKSAERMANAILEVLP